MAEECEVASLDKFGFEHVDISDSEPNKLGSLPELSQTNLTPINFVTILLFYYMIL